MSGSPAGSVTSSAGALAVRPRASSRPPSPLPPPTVNQSAAAPAASTATASPAVSGVIRSRTVREAVAGPWVPVMLLYGPVGPCTT